MKIGQANVDFDTLLIESPVGRFPMEAKVMAVLRILTDNANQVVSRDQLIDTVWGVEFGGDERLSRAISILRKAFGDLRGHHTHIETIPRRGYRLIAKVSHHSDIIVSNDDVTKVDLSPQNISEKDRRLRHNAEAQILTSPSNTGSSHETDTVLHKKRRFVRPVFAIFAVLIATGILWMSPIGKSIAGFPDEARVDTGLTYVQNFAQREAIPKAQDIFARILAGDPDHAAARAGLALALIREYTHLEADPALLRRAKATAEASLRLDPNLALANIAVGWAAEFEGDFEKAHKAYDRADILDPNNIFTLEGRARTFNKQGQRDEAKQIAELGISLYPKYVIYYSYVGQLLLARDNYIDSEAMFRKVIALSNGKHPRAYAQLAQTLHLQDRTSEAINVLQDGLEINETPFLYSNLGTYLFFQGQYETSAEAFERALAFKGNSHHYLLWANLADAYRWVPTKKSKANQSYDRALQLLKVELDKRPTDVVLNSRAALYHAKRGNLEAARSALSRVHLNGSVSANEYYRAVITYDILAERQLALTTLERTLKAGYPLTEILNDPELSNLRQDPNYHRLLSTLNPKKDDPL